jgi:anti-sigma factor RsiW
VAQPAPAPATRERNAADSGTHWNQLSVIDSEPCRRARRTLSVVLDGEASATEVAEIARHLSGCDYCARFAAVVAELKLRLAAASPERLEELMALQRPP